MTFNFGRYLCLALAAGCATAGASLHAQGSTWVVDASAGTGSNFTSIPPAVAAAADGDTILVRAGSYGGFSTSKGITVLGEPGVTLNTLFTLGPIVEVTGLQQHQRFVLAGINAAVHGVPSGNGIVIRNCTGTVHLDNIGGSSGPIVGTGPALEVHASRHVTATDCDFFGHPGVLAASGSFLTLTDCDATGAPACQSLRCTAFDASAGVTVLQSVVQLAQTSVTGGRGSFVLPTLSRPPAPGVLLSGSELLVTGDASTVIRAGDLAGGPPTAAIGSALGSGPSSVTFNPTVTLLGSQGGAALGGVVTGTQRHVPTVTADGAAPGGLLQITLRTAAQNQVVLLLGPAGRPTRTPLGDFVLDPLATTSLFSGLQPPGGLLSLALAVPANPSLSGLALMSQAGVFDVASNRIVLSTGSSFVLH